MIDHPPTPFTRRAIAGLAAGILLLAACSAGGAAGPSSTSAGNAPPAGGGSSSAASAAVGAGGGGAAGCANPAGATVGAYGGAVASIVSGVLCGMPDIDPCAYLDPASVQALFAVTLDTPTTDHLGNCTWPLTDPSVGDGLEVVVNVGQGEGPLDADMGIGGGTTAITGIGDKADWQLLAGYFPHLGAVKGNTTCELTAGGGNAQLNVATTGTGPLAGIDPSAVPGFMAKFGQLCNQIFAGLATGGPPPSQVASQTTAQPRVDPCSVLAAADVQALFKAALGTPQSPLTGECDWALSDPSKGDGGLTLHVDRSQAGLTQDMVLAPKMTSLTGVGDSAKWGLAVGVDPLLIATKGDHGCELAITGDLTQLNVATVPGIYTTIDPTALPGFIQQLGGLCTKVFAGLGS
jgi:hypothetical protein